MPADIVNGRLEFINGTRQFKSIIKYHCNPGYVLVGRNELMCDVDQRWNGPPPRCEPIYCDEPQQIRYGGFSLSTNSTRFGTVVTYYCTSPRHELVGPKKITCLKDGSYNTGPPVCRESLKKEKVRIPATIPKIPDTKRPAYREPTRKRPILNGNGDSGIRRPFAPGRPQFPRKPIDFSPEGPRPQRPKIVNDRDEDVFSARPPIDNEIPDSANVQNSPAGANVPTPVENESESRQAQLNLGKTILDILYLKRKCHSSLPPFLLIMQILCTKNREFSIMMKNVSFGRNFGKTNTINQKLELKCKKFFIHSN